MKIVNHSIFTFYIVGQHHHVLCSRLLPPSRYKLHICTLSVISVSMVLPSPNTWPTLHFWMNLNQFPTTSNALLSSFIKFLSLNGWFSYLDLKIKFLSLNGWISYLDQSLTTIVIKLIFSTSMCNDALWLHDDFMSSNWVNYDNNNRCKLFFMFLLGNNPPWHRRKHFVNMFP